MTPTVEASRRLMSGNAAIARGAWEGGVRVATAYPGTPSTEILEEMAQYDDVDCEWSTNEKVALEVAVGASVAGGRTRAAMKHVGVNVAADPQIFACGDAAFGHGTVTQGIATGRRAADAIIRFLNRGRPS